MNLTELVRRQRRRDRADLGELILHASGRSRIAFDFARHLLDDRPAACRPARTAPCQRGRLEALQCVSVDRSARRARTALRVSDWSRRCAARGPPCTCGQASVALSKARLMCPPVRLFIDVAGRAERHVRHRGAGLDLEQLGGEVNRTCRRPRTRRTACPAFAFEVRDHLGAAFLAGRLGCTTSRFGSRAIRLTPAGSPSTVSNGRSWSRGTG